MSPRRGTAREQVSFRLTRRTKHLLTLLAEKRHGSLTAALEESVEELALKEGLSVRWQEADVERARRQGREWWATFKLPPNRSAGFPSVYSDAIREEVESQWLGTVTGWMIGPPTSVLEARFVVAESCEPTTDDLGAALSARWAEITDGQGSVSVRPAAPSGAV